MKTITILSAALVSIFLGCGIAATDHRSSDDQDEQVTVDLRGDANRENPLDVKEPTRRCNVYLTCTDSEGGEKHIFTCTVDVTAATEHSAIDQAAEYCENVATGDKRCTWSYELSTPTCGQPK